MAEAQFQVFDITEHLQKNAVQRTAASETLETEAARFQEVCTKVKAHFEKLYDSNKVTNEELRERHALEYQAMIGKAEAESVLTAEIEGYLRDENFLGVQDFPEFYETIAEACFHEIYRFGSFAKWRKYPDSPSGVIQGDEIWFLVDGKFQRQEERLRDQLHVHEIIRSFSLKHKGLRINENHPEAEFDMDDGTRVKVVVPPRSYRPTIIFRRFVIRRFSFEQQAKKNTIPLEDVSLYRLLAKLPLNTVVAGRVQSGKSTFLKTIYAEREPHLVAVLIETNPESFLKRDFPDRLVHDFYTSDGNIHQVIRDALRTDHDYIIVQEVRGIEAEGAIAGTERGTTGLLMSYHITNPKNTPKQLARHIIDEFPRRSEDREIKRIAEQLDLGITMTSLKNNEKRVTSVYEMCYDEELEQAWINYLILYDAKTNTWTYNAGLSESLARKMRNLDESLYESFIRLLKERARQHPITGKTEFACH
ncbi:MAG TPA: ATPase, T2SS/T4P/T4SS family [Bacillales bacterium]|nr:ATPase, T2SS/T4P/T4SS family [Bacillales bacterium]